MTVEITAKKVEDAIKDGLAQLGTTLDRVTVEVLESGGLFKKAKVRLTLDEEEPAPKTKTLTAPAQESSKPQTKTEKHEKADKADKPEKPAKSDKVEKVEKADKAEKVVKTEKKAKPQQAAGKPEKPKAEKAKPSKNDGAPRTSAQSGSQDGQRAEEKDDVGASAEKSRAQKGSPAKKQQQRSQGERRKKTDEELKTLADARAFVEEIVRKMGFDATVTADEAEPERINITAPEGDDSLIIGRHGETLSALSYLAETCARAEKSHISVIVDCNGYRERRAASLTAMARRRANECAAKRRKIRLEPMERIDRRTIHNALGDDDRVTTSSEGKEPYRYIVIYPARGNRPERRNDDSEE